MAQYYGKLDFSRLCRLWRDHRELFEMVDFKDGKHALLKVNLNERKEADEHGNTHYLQAACKKDQRKDGVNYYIGDNFRQSQNEGGNNTPQTGGTTVNETSDDLPF